MCILYLHKMIIYIKKDSRLPYPIFPNTQFFTPKSRTTRNPFPTRPPQFTRKSNFQGSHTLTKQHQQQQQQQPLTCYLLPLLSRAIIRDTESVGGGVGTLCSAQRIICLSDALNIRRCSGLYRGSSTGLIPQRALSLSVS